MALQERHQRGLFPACLVPWFVQCVFTLTSKRGNIWKMNHNNFEICYASVENSFEV